MSVLDSLEFAPVLIMDVFESMKASASWYDKVHLKSGSGQNLYLSQTQSANSIAAIVADQGAEPEPGNCITITLKTQATFYQPAPFYTAQNFLIFRHAALNQENGLLLVTILRDALKKFSWGYGVSMARLRRLRIMVPVITSADGETVVDWEGMTRLGEELFATAVERSAEARQVLLPQDDTLPELTFEPMYVVDVPGHQAGLFHAHKGKRLNTAHRTRGTTPFVAASKMNNSIVDYANVEPLFPGGWLTLIYDGDGGTGNAKYQPAPFSAADSVIALEPISDEATEDALIVIVTLLTHQCVPKFGFGYKLTLHRLSRQKIMVPVTTNANGDTVADWTGLAAYGRALRVRAEHGMNAVLEPRSL